MTSPFDIPLNHTFDEEQVANLVKQYYAPESSYEEKQQATTELFLRFRPLIKHTVRKVRLVHYLVDEEEAENIAALEFVSLIQRFDPSRSTPYYFPKYVQDCLEWQVRKGIKRSYRKFAQEEPVQEIDDESVLVKPNNDDLTDAATNMAEPREALEADLYDAYCRMSRKQQNIVKLILSMPDRDQTQAEIAAHLARIEGQAVSQQAVSARLQQIRRLVEQTTARRPRGLMQSGNDDMAG